MKNFFLPTPTNNYRAYLLSNSALIIYVIILILTNILFGQSVITKTYALLDIGNIIELHNVERRQNDLGDLEFNPILAESARLKGEAMLADDCWSHYCPEGTSPWEFFKEVDYDYIFAGENLAEGFGDSEIVMNAWMNSKTHRENVLKPQFTEVGIAIVYGSFQGIKNNAVVVVHFGTPLPEEIKNEVSRSESDSIQITKPEDGEINNERRPTIEGLSDSNLELEINNQRSGSIIPNGGVFTYNPDFDFSEGLNKITAENISQGIEQETEQKSDSINYFLDVTPPEFDLDKLEVDYIVKNQDDQDNWILRYSDEQSYDIDLLQIYSGDNKYEAKKTSGGIISIQIKSDDINESTRLSAIDEAGNTSESLLSSEQISRLKTEANNAEVILIPNSTDSTNNIFGIFKDFFNPIDITWFRLIIMGFIGFLVMLIIFEIRTKYKRKDYELIEESRSNASFHLATLGILFILVLTGGLSGAI